MNEKTRRSMARDIALYRKAVWRDMLVGTFKERSAFEISSIQLMTLFILDETGSLSVKQVSEKLGRSVSAVSRMIDEMVSRGWVDRQEDTEDRRAKRIALASAGRAFLESLESRRISAQMDLVEELAAADQKTVAEAMRLLAEAAGRRGNASK